MLQAGMLLLTVALACAVYKAAEYRKRASANPQPALKKTDRSDLWKDKTIPYLPEIQEALLAQNPKNTHELIVLARKYVRAAFVMKYDEWYHRYKYDTEKVVATIYLHHQDPEKNPPAHLDCQPCSRALASILHYLGLETRLIALLSDDYDYVASHACLEVYNPDSKTWELHDTGYDVHYVDREDGRVLSALDLLFGDLDQVVPTDDLKSGWDEKFAATPSILRDHYFEVVGYYYVTKRCFCLINTERIDTKKRFPKNDNANMVEFLNLVYGQPAIFGFSSGSSNTFSRQLPARGMDLADSTPRRPRKVMEIRR